MEFSQAVSEKLGNYVYILKNPRDKNIFYVGKGRGNRLFSHLNRALENATVNDKYDLINSIISDGLEVQHYILRHNLSEELAFEIESSCIDLLGLEYLTNEVSGHNAWERSLKTINEIVQQYDATSIIIDEPSIIIIINKLYKRFMTEIELYNVTRHRWRIGVKRDQVKYAIAAYKGLVREVYAVQGWTKCEDGRYEFYGQVALPNVREKYINQSLDMYLKKGNQSPIRYTF